MKSASTVSAILLLLAGLSAVSCYEPVDLKTGETVDIPWVHCLLTPDGAQHLLLGYVSPSGTDDFRGINDARVVLSGWNEQKKVYEPLDDFVPVGNGEWELPELEKRSSYQLEVFLPRGDTLSAYTSIPDKPTLSYRHVGPVDTTDVAYLRLHGKDYSFSKWRAYYSIQANNPVWVYMERWSDASDSWVIEEELTSNHEELADAFNLTGQSFTHCATPEILEAFPEVVGNPLHARYIRFPRLAMSDTLCFAGDFKGRYIAGYSDLFISFEQYHIVEDMYYTIIGVPYDPAECEWVTKGHAGRLRFLIPNYEYDRYLRSVEQYRLLHETGTDIVGIYDNSNIYSNIRGGTGIFGSFTEITTLWSCGEFINL